MADDQHSGDKNSARREAFDKAGYWPNEVLWKVWNQAWDAADAASGLELAHFVLQHPQAACGMGDVPHAQWEQMQRMAAAIAERATSAQSSNTTNTAPQDRQIASASPETGANTNRPAGAVPSSKALNPAGWDAEVTRQIAPELDRIAADTRRAAHADITVAAPVSIEREPIDRLIRAMGALLGQCDLTSEGETDFERAVIEAQRALAGAMAWQVRRLDPMKRSLPRVWGVSRMFDNEQALLVSLDRKPTNDEMRDIHDLLAGRALPEERKG